MSRLNTAVFAAAVFFASFSLYLATASPSNYFGDSGELIAAAYTLGIPHPTGFPVFMLLGKLFTLLPVASAAFRMNLLSALSGAMACAALFLAFRFSAGRDKGPAVSVLLPAAAALIFTLSYTLWSQSVVARIYSMNAFFCAAALASFTYFTVIRPSKQALYLLAFLTGTGAGLHLSFLIFAAILWLYLLVMHRKEALGSLLPSAAFLLLGATVYLYITLRGSSGAAFKWADLYTTEQLQSYLSQAQYKIKMFSRDAGGYARYFAFIWESVSREFSPAGLLLFSAGAVWAAVRKDRYFWPMLAVFLSNIAMLAVYGNDSDLRLSFRYLIPSYIAAAYFIWLFLSYLHGAFADSRRGAAVAIAAAIAVMAACYIKGIRENDRSENFIAYNYPHDLVSRLGENSSLFTNGDNQIYPLAYAKFAEKRYPSLTVYDQIDTVFKDIRELWKTSNTPKPGTNIIAAFSAGKYPVYTTTLTGTPGIYSALNGIAYMLDDRQAPSGAPWAFRTYPLKGILRGPQVFHAFEEREVVATYYLRMAEAYRDSGNRTVYTGLLEKASVAGYDSPPMLGNAAIMWSADSETPGAMEKAGTLFERALALDPKSESICFNAGSYYAKAGKWDKALSLFNTAIKQNPGNVMAIIYKNRVEQEMAAAKAASESTEAGLARYEEGKKLMSENRLDEAIEAFSADIGISPSLDRSYFHIGLIYSMRGEFDKAIPFYEKAAANNPRNTAAYNNLGIIYTKLGRNDMAREVLKKSLSADPNQEQIKNVLKSLR